MDETKFFAYCGELEKAISGALTWVQNNQELVGNGSYALRKKLRHSGRLVRQCSIAAKRKMCAGVFGPSQSGKSYLLSALARDSDNNLIARFDKEQKDFLNELNPEGGKESTGLVTRFTLTEPPSMPAGFPVHLRLLTEIDLVKIIANTYFSDIKHTEVPDENEIFDILKSATSKTSNQNSHITIDDIEDLEEYINQEFKEQLRVVTLKKGYWTQLAEIAPKLEMEDRIPLYAIIWDNVPQFTSLFSRLMRDLKKLDFATDAWCTLNALIPREDSIIDVAMLKRLGKDNSNLDI